MKLSIIIPVYREQPVICQTLDRLLSLNIPCPFEIIISDGEPDHSTLNEVRDKIRTRAWTGIHRESPMTEADPIRLVRSKPGRGTQMNTGAAQAGGDILFFLHADTLLDQQGMDLLVENAAAQTAAFFCGAFDLCINSPKKIFRVIEKTASIRSRLTKIPYGDQGIFISKPLFESVGKFPDFPIMEDVGLMEKIKASGVSPVFLPHPISTSARRWEKQGIVYTTLRNWALVSLYFAGVRPDVLVRYY